MSRHTNQKGFTIVELLIVIVVIAILAAISIVAYTGIQSRAKTSSGQQLASQVEKKAQAFYVINNAYPANYAGFAGTSEAALEGIPTGNLLIQGTITSSEGADGKTIAYQPCGTAPHTGARITYFNYSTNAPVQKTIGTGC